MIFPLTNTTSTFSTRYDANYERPPSLAIIAGTYAGSADGITTTTTTTTTISSTGAISGSSTGGCRFTGSTKPRTAGNLYDYSITFGGAPCELPNQTLRGVAATEATGRAILAAGVDATRQAGFVFFGTKVDAAGDAPAMKSTAFGEFTSTVKGTGLLILR